MEKCDASLNEMKEVRNEGLCVRGVSSLKRHQNINDRSESTNNEGTTFPIYAGIIQEQTVLFRLNQYLFSLYPSLWFYSIRVAAEQNNKALLMAHPLLLRKSDRHCFIFDRAWWFLGSFAKWMSVDTTLALVEESCDGDTAAAAEPSVLLLDDDGVVVAIAVYSHCETSSSRCCCWWPFSTTIHCTIEQTQSLYAGVSICGPPPNNPCKHSMHNRWPCCITTFWNTKSPKPPVAKTDFAASDNLMTFQPISCDKNNKQARVEAFSPSNPVREWTATVTAVSKLSFHRNPAGQYRV